ncbi:MAG TPA: hypothetical protein VLL52_21070 [Anaerolineae bacterium]|nr:hypothetical protein [Anaerolineae bacterium]
MELIERYLQAIGRLLPAKQRDDILTELRSSLYDALETEDGLSQDKAQIEAVIQQMGAPQKVASAYYPQGDYLIGPSLFPLFKQVVGTVVAVLVGIQLVAMLLSFMLGNQTPTFIGELWGVVNGLPTAFGMIVLIFWALQRFDVQVDDDEAFDPKKLPALTSEGEVVDRFGQIISVIIQLGVLGFLAGFVQQGGFQWIDGSSVVENPVIRQYLPWLGVSLVLGVALDVVLLWHGRWQTKTRLAYIGTNLFSLVLLGLLIRGHRAWLAAEGVTDAFPVDRELWTEAVNGGGELAVVGMSLFLTIFVIVAIVVLIDTIVNMVKLVRGMNQANGVGQKGIGLMAKIVG